jgi:hypothetical protein
MADVWPADSPRPFIRNVIDGALLSLRRLSRSLARPAPTLGLCRLGVGFLVVETFARTSFRRYRGYRTLCAACAHPDLAHVSGEFGRENITVLV